MVRAELVGREQEVAFLDECLGAVLTGQPRIVLCRGEPGIGKTRLAEELAALAGERGVPAVWARGAESDGAPPYWPWRQLLRALSDLLDLAALAEEHQLAGDVSGLAPDVFPSATAADSGSAEDRFRKFDAVARLLHHVAARTPLVIIFEDVHWADQPTLLLLQHVARSLSGERLLLVVSSRDTEPMHTAIVTQLVREPVARELHLGGLPASAVARQLAAVVGHDVSDEEAEEVRVLTGGNPFFVGEVGRVMADPRAAGGSSSVTPSLRNAIDARLDRLSPACVRLLQAASVVGREFPVARIAAIVDEPVAGCLGQLDEAMSAGFVEMSATPGEHRFVHALIRTAIEAGLPTSERVRLHRRAAEAVEHEHAGRLGPHLFDLARHWRVAALQGNTATASGWIRLAAEEAMRSLAFEEAARLFQLAVDVGGAELDDCERCWLLLQVAGARHASADVEGRLDACLEAAALARRIERPDLIAEAALILEGVFGYPESDLATRRLCEEAIAGLNPEHVALRARVDARYAEACMYLGDVESAGPASEKALVLAEECGDRRALVATLHARRLVCEGPDGIAERQRLAERMLALSQDGWNPRVEMWGRLWRVDACFERGDLVAAAHELDALGHLAREVGGPWAQWQLLRGQAVLAQAQARFTDARRLAHQAFSAIARTGDPIAGLPRAGLLQTVGHHTGQDPESLAASGLADATADELEIPPGVVMMVLGPSLVLVEAGRLPEAAGLYRSLGPVAGWRPHAHATLAAYALGIGVAVALGATGDVAALRRMLEPYRGLHVASGAGAVAYVGPVALWLGVAAAHLGLLDDAVSDLELAVRACSINGADGFHSEAQLELATVLARRAGRGDLARARSLVADAGRQAADLGMVPILSRARHLIEQLDAAERPTPLSPREHEVAELVARGMTNREIAGQLYVSERTAQNHVQHILTKLDLSNRSQIAVWMTGRRE